MSITIPKILWQTTQYDVKDLPYYLVNGYIDGYEHHVYDDKKCEEFISHSFPYALAAFHTLQGAHRADLWRYCILYHHGGVYLDIKTVLRAPLSEIFPTYKDKFTWYVVLCTSGTCVYNGIIASPPRNPVFLELINHIVQNNPPSHYLQYVENMKFTIEVMYNMKMREGVFENSWHRLVTRQEQCRKKECAKTLQPRRDRYKLCCNVYDKNINKTEPIITVRDADYPWGKESSESFLKHISSSVQVVYRYYVHSQKYVPILVSFVAFIIILVMLLIMKLSFVRKT